MSPREIDRLREICAHELVLELGAWHGLTTVEIARVASGVVSVDHHQGDDDCGHTNTLGAYMANLEEYGVRSSVITVVARFSLALQVLIQRSFGVVIVDGAHDPRSVRHDITWARRMVRRKGVIAVHDWDKPVVSEAGTVILGAPDEIVDTLATWSAP